jgi:hypothetical protein
VKIRRAKVKTRRPAHLPQIHEPRSLFTGVRGRRVLGSMFAHSCIASVQRPSNLKSPLEETPYWVKFIL